MTRYGWGMGKPLFFSLLFCHVSERASPACLSALGTPLSSSARWEHLLPNGTDCDRANEGDRESEGEWASIYPTRGDVTPARARPVRAPTCTLSSARCVYLSVAPSILSRYLVFGRASRMPRSHRIQLPNLDNPIKKLMRGTFKGKALTGYIDCLASVLK